MGPPVDRTPPQNLEAEQSVLGSMLLDREAVYTALNLLVPEDFYRQANKLIFEAISHLADASEPADTVTVVEELRRRGQLEEVGGISYIAALADSVPSAANVEYYCRIIEEKSLLRRLIAAAVEITNTAYDGGLETEELLDAAERKMFEISSRRRIRPYVALKDLLAEAMDHIEFLVQNKGSFVGVPSGFKDLDELTSGFHPSELIVLAARPSVGKTTLSLNIASHVAVQASIPVAFFSLEMSRDQLAQRLLCAEVSINSHRLRTGYLSDEDWKKISLAAARLGQAPFYVDDSPNLSLMEVRSRARRLKSERDIGFMVIDYLQLLHTRSRAENRQQEISEISRSLKGLARELEIPIMALSQLSRAVEQREKKRPQLSDLRESGAIEQDADVVLFIYDNPAPDKVEDGVIELILAKQRNGPVGSVEVLFRRDVGKFVNLDRRYGNTASRA